MFGQGSGKESYVGNFSALAHPRPSDYEMRMYIRPLALLISIVRKRHSYAFAGE
jgi:hypothetical protein